MKQRTIILITILITIAVLVGGYFAWKYELDRNQSSFDKGYTNGLLYTQQSGNIVLVENGTLIEKPVTEICSILIQQQLNQQGGQ